MMQELRDAVPFEEFDYQVLMDALRAYRRPRDKVSQLLATGQIVRVKKGLYVFGEGWRRQPVSVEVLANLVYGPSYISGPFALAHYGLIPERVYAVTSMTTGKRKAFETPLGLFQYEHLSLRRYQVGLILLELGRGRSCLFATPEKAVADLVYGAPRIASVSDMREHLTQNLRMEADSLRQLKGNQMEEIAAVYRSRNVRLLSGVLS
jgi:hypothetical protein